MGGTLLGGSLVLSLYVADSVPAHIERLGIGAAGERRTVRGLRLLQRVGWPITHDLDVPGAGNIDHLAVGPAGVFVLDSKAWSGIVTVDQDGATITPRDAPDAAWLARGEHRAATRTAARAARALAASAGRTVPAAQSVIVVWGTFPQRVAVSGGVTYVVGEHVHDWLIGQRACLNRTELAALSAVNIPSFFGSESSHLLQPGLPEVVSRPGSDSSRDWFSDRCHDVAAKAPAVQSAKSPQDVQFRPGTAITSQPHNRRSSA